MALKCELPASFSSLDTNHSHSALFLTQPSDTDGHRKLSIARRVSWLLPSRLSLFSHLVMSLPTHAARMLGESWSFPLYTPSPSLSLRLIESVSKNTLSLSTSMLPPDLSYQHLTSAGALALEQTLVRCNKPPACRAWSHHISSTAAGERMRSTPAAPTEGQSLS